MSSLVFTRSPQPYFPFPIRVTIAGDGLGMSLRIYCRLGYRINTKYLFTFRLCAFGRLPVTLVMFWRLQSPQFFFLLEPFFGHDRSAPLWCTLESFAPTLQVFALLTNVYLSFLFVCYSSVLTETYVVCPDGSECLDYETCCMMDTGHYGCCPLPKAVCCSDEEHCCPEGYRWSYYWMLIYFTLAPMLSRESMRGGVSHKLADLSKTTQREMRSRKRAEINERHLPC